MCCMFFRGVESIRVVQDLLHPQPVGFRVGGLGLRVSEKWRMSVQSLRLTSEDSLYIPIYPRRKPFKGTLLFASLDP